jgi:hypothetical protein
MGPISIAVDRSRAAPRSTRRQHILSGSRALDHQHRHDTLPHSPFDKVILGRAKKIAGKKVFTSQIYSPLSAPLRISGMSCKITFNKELWTSKCPL